MLPWGVLRHVARAWRSSLGLGAAVLLCLFVQQGFATYFAVSLKLLIDRALLPDGRQVLWRVLAALLLGSLLSIAAAVLEGYLTARVSARVLSDLRARMFRALQALSLGYHAGAKSGDVGARFGNDLAELEKGLVERPIDGASALIGLGINLPLLCLLDWRLFALVALLLPATLLGGRGLLRRAAAASYERKRQEARLGAEVGEGVRLQPVIQAYGLGEIVGGRFAARLREVRRSTFRESFLSALVATSASQAVLLVQLLGVAAGALLCASGRLSPGGLAAAASLLANVVKDAYALAKKVVPALLKASGGLRRVAELLQERPAVVDRPGAADLAAPPAELRLDGVSFSYDGGRRQLEGLSLVIRAGTRVALVGPSGSGKSTVLALLGRLYDPQEGAVRFDGRDLRELSSASLRRQLGYVFQDALLFDSTIADNIRMGSPGADQAAVERAARAAELHEQVCALPLGYETPVGELGGRLSGGLRQRVALARALLRDPPILLLDEATSALDATTAAALERTIDRLAAGRTVITVTHHLAAAQRADEIFVLREGRLVESGPHEALLGRGGLYAALWRSATGSS